MSRFTDLIESRYEPATHKSMRKYLQTFGVTQQKFNNWRDGAVPEDKVLMTISEKLGINFLKLIALAKITDAKGTAETKAEWKRIATIIEREEKGDLAKLLS